MPCLALALWFIHLSPAGARADFAAPSSDVYISEIIASNQDGLEDEDGDSCDWIELHNRGAAPAELAGWSLSDDPQTPGKWILPGVTLDPDGYLIVFASDKNRATAGAELHASFKLAAEGEYLGLYDDSPPRVAVHAFAPGFPAQRTDVAYGWHEATAQWIAFEAPTPGAQNVLPIPRVEPVGFSVPRGFHGGPVTLTLTCATPGATILATLDGRQPTADHGTTVTAPLTIEATSVVRARAVKTGLADSTIETHTYLIGLGAAQRSLPVVSIVGDPETDLYEPQGIMAVSGGTYDANGYWHASKTGDYNRFILRGREHERPVSVEWLTTPEAVEAGAPPPAGFNCGLRVHGSDDHRRRYRRGEDWSQKWNKISFNLFFRGEYGMGRLSLPVIAQSPLRSFDSLVIQGGKNDYKNPFIHDELVRRLFLDAGHLAPHGDYVNLFINGRFKHYYNFSERLDGEWLNDLVNDKCDWDIIQEYDSVEEGDKQAYLALMNFVKSHALDTRANYEEVERRLDLDNFIDYLILELYAANGDWTPNWTMARPRREGGRFEFVLWDVEATMYAPNVRANLFDASPLYGASSGLNQTSVPFGVLYQRLKACPEFRLRFADRAARLFGPGGAYDQENLTRHFEALRARMQPSIHGMITSTGSVWIPQREAIVLDQFAGQGLAAALAAPRLVRHGGAIDRATGMAFESQPEGDAILYTTDGSDPRAGWTDRPTTAAQTYTGAVALNRLTPVSARAWRAAPASVQWSALCQADFLTAAPGEVLITEFMANPEGEDAGREWFEVFNTTERPINLEGWVIADNRGQRHEIRGAAIAPGAAGAGAGARVPRPLMLAPWTHMTFGQSADPARNGGIPVDYAYGEQFELDNDGGEIILVEGDCVVDSVGYGQPRPTRLAVRQCIGQALRGGRALGLGGDYSAGAPGAWCYQACGCGTRGDRGTPGAVNDGASLSHQAADNGVSAGDWAGYR